MNCTNKSFIVKRKAFTLIELLIVIAIIGILFIVLISKVDFASDKAKATGVQTDFRSFQLAFEQVSRENAGFNTFGWDTGDLNANGKRDSYDEGDTNKDNIEDAGEVWTGHKVPGETFTNVFTLVKPGTTFETDGYNSDAIAKLETAINANLDPKLHITIGTDGKITMANGAQDPWDKEYHGYYITNATVDKKDQGAIVMYSNGANGEFGSEHTIVNGIVSISIPGNNKYGKDDYALAVVYTYTNGYGEVKTSTSGFSQNQDATNNSNNGDNLGDVNNVPVIGDTKQFATLIASSTLKDIYDLSTSPDKEDGYASIAYNNNTYLCIDYFDDVYDIYYEFYNESEDCWYDFAYATEGIVELGYASEVGWHTYNDYGDLIPCAAPSITFAQDLIIDMPNGLSDIAPLFVDHKHNYINCECACGDTNHNYINCKCVVCGDINHNYINYECACGAIKPIDKKASLNDYTWIEIKAISRMNLTESQLSSQYNIHLGDSKTENGYTYIVVDLYDNEYDGFVFVYDAQFSEYIRSNAATSEVTHLQTGGYKETQIVHTINNLYDTYSEDLQNAIKPVSIKCNKGGWDTGYYYLDNMYVFAPSMVEITGQLWEDDDSDRTWSNCFSDGQQFDLFVNNYDAWRAISNGDSTLSRTADIADENWPVLWYIFDNDEYPTAERTNWWAWQILPCFVIG